MNFASLPAIGQPLEGGRFFGLTTGKDGTHSAIVLLPDVPPSPLTWQAAMDWAVSVGGELPTRPVSAQLFALADVCTEPFEKDWHWTSETHRSDASYAWSQDFLNGFQYLDPKSSEERARAVRLIPLVD